MTVALAHMVPVRTRKGVVRWELFVPGMLLLVDCIGRIDLGEHWPSDVLAGLALGLGWTALALSIRWLSNPSLDRSR